ncbi:hypothetical protein B0T17DRAFT_505807 [Bombardia bombarda]|uniref:Uncharacterized protein n=1 Tax=Bombardia bombarda TaxID=252184 RepID=A0AA39X8E3_9PEZI|nr:hypothetical protein B0T17DRAFT_505807 [Bombardia bombarda]
MGNAITPASTMSLVILDLFWSSEINSALVNTRAWAVQERFLAPRVLHFGRRQLIWECREKDAAEMYPKGLPPNLSRLPDARFKSFDQTILMEQTGGFNFPKIPMKLGICCGSGLLRRNYMRCGLTFPNDKLIACSGMAKMMKQILNDEYVAGMWRKYLEAELLWAVLSSGTSSRPAEYRAPSWSWASVDGDIHPQRRWVRNPPIIVKDIHLDYKTDDVTGEISGGWLRVLGVLKRTKLTRKTWITRRRDVRYWHMSLEGIDVTDLGLEDSPDPKIHVSLDVDQEDFEQESSQDLLFSMCAKPPSENKTIMYLLLFKLVSREKATFRRIGIAHAFDETVKNHILSIERGVEEPQLPCIEYRDGLHSIYVI